MNQLFKILVSGAAAAALFMPLNAEAEGEPVETAESPSAYATRISVEAMLSAINAQRAEAGSGELALNDTLMDIASQRLAELESYPAGHAIAVTQSQLSSETLVRGNADPNTALSAILLSEKQKKNLVYDGYHQFGFAVNESGNLWIFLMTS